MSWSKISTSSKQGGSMLMRAFIIGLLVITVRASHADTLIHAGRVLNVRTGQYSENQGILISNKKIASIEPWNKISQTISAQVMIIDLSTQTLLPGLIDVHTHLLMNSPASMGYTEALISKSIPYRVLEGAVAARLTLEAGFTTVRDVQSEGAGFADVALRDAIDNGLIPGPRMQVATRAIAALGYYYPQGVAPEYQAWLNGAQNVSGLEEAQRAVREQIHGGADLIKIFADFSTFPREGAHPTLTLEEIRMITSEAHRAKRKVAAHATTPEGIRNAVEGGVDSIEHGYMIDLNELSLMAARGVVFVPTTRGLFDTIEHSNDTYMVKRANKRISNLRTAFKKAREIGVIIANGSDAHSTEAHGDNVHELVTRVRLGLSPLEVIQAATINAATLMSCNTKIGTLEVGKYADIIAISGDPLEDIAKLKDISFVMKEGKIYKNNKRATTD
jgi:imidazolonepropionase-like amidohydrolase